MARTLPRLRTRIEVIPDDPHAWIPLAPVFLSVLIRNQRESPLIDITSLPPEPSLYVNFTAAESLSHANLSAPSPPTALSLFRPTRPPNSNSPSKCRRNRRQKIREAHRKLAVEAENDTTRTIAANNFVINLAIHKYKKANRLQRQAVQLTNQAITLGKNASVAQAENKVATHSGWIPESRIVQQSLQKKAMKKYQAAVKSLSSLPEILGVGVQ